MSCISSYGISTKRERSKEKSEQVRREKVGDIEGVAEEVRSLEVALCSSQRARILDKVALIVGSTELVVVLGTGGVTGPSSSSERSSSSEKESTEVGWGEGGGEEVIVIEGGVVFEDWGEGRGGE
jgi:hypothetical protein